MKFLLLGTVSASLVLMLTGCGGSGSADSWTDAVPLHTFVVGDTWQLTNVQTKPGSAPSLDYSERDEVVMHDFQGVPHLAIKENYTVADQPDYFDYEILEQDPVTHELFVVGNASDRGEFVYTRSTLLPGEVRLGTTWTVYEGGSDDNKFIYTVDRKGSITTPAGTFTAFHYNMSNPPGVNSDTFSAEGWICPELGIYPVQNYHFFNRDVNPPTLDVAIQLQSLTLVK